MGVKIEAHVPFRMRVLLKYNEHEKLEKAIARFTTGGQKIIELLEVTIQKKHRIVYGTVFEGSFEYKDADGGDGNIGVESFMRSEFPGYSYDTGDVGEDGETPVEFVITGNFTAVLFKSPKSGPVRLFVRRGQVEMDFTVPGALPSIAEAILTAEKEPLAATFLANVSAEIVNCNLLGE